MRIASSVAAMATPSGLALAAWGDRWAAGDAGPPVLQRHRTCAQITQVEMRCAACEVRDSSLDFGAVYRV
jgi:hypothetical protein